MYSKKLPTLERGDLPRITKLTRLSKMNEGKGYSYAYVKACFDPENPRRNEEIIALGWQLVESRERSMAQLAKVRSTKTRNRS